MKHTSPRLNWRTDLDAARAIGLPPKYVAVVRDAELEGRYVVKLVGAFSNKVPVVK